MFVFEALPILILLIIGVIVLVLIPAYKPIGKRIDKVSSYIKEEMKDDGTGEIR
jgi:F0F1-type ATP synthase membrane subunit b/b'